MLQDFQFKIIHHAGSKHLNVDAISWNPTGFPKEDEVFGSDVLEHEKQLGITPLPARNNVTNDVNINLFALQHIEQKVNGGRTHARNECGKQSTNSFSEEGLPPMNHMEYKKMVIEVQTIVDEAKNKQKGKIVEIVRQSEDDQSRQMDI